jgi:hypothetical protein
MTKKATSAINIFSICSKFVTKLRYILCILELGSATMQPLCCSHLFWWDLSESEWDPAEWGWYQAGCGWDTQEAECGWDLDDCGWDLAECGWYQAGYGWDIQKAECGWDLAESGWDLSRVSWASDRQCQSRHAAMGSIPESPDNREKSEGRQMKKCWKILLSRSFYLRRDCAIFTWHSHVAFWVSIR